MGIIQFIYFFFGRLFFANQISGFKDIDFFIKFHIGRLKSL